MPDILKQNGIAKRKNRALTNMMRSMMSTCNLSEFQSGEETTAYIFNRVPCKSVATSPFELRIVRKLSLNHLLVVVVQQR